jgi:hypothetical protein
MRLGLKGLTFLLLLFLLVLCSSIRLCDARGGKHWRRSRATSTSMLRKGKPKSSSSHKQNGKGNQSPYQPSPSTSPVSPSGSPVQRKGGQGPTMPTPGGGSGCTVPPPPLLRPPPPPSPPAAQDTVFNVVDFGAKGDGVTDDTQVTITALKILCFQLGHFCHLHHTFWVIISFSRHPGIFSLFPWLLLLSSNELTKLMSIRITPHNHYNIRVQFRNATSIGISNECSARNIISH